MKSSSLESIFIDLMKGISNVSEFPEKNFSPAISASDLIAKSGKNISYK